ncbi:MAG: hypothetical protein ACRERD_31280 [Candidatus Binatia bacterium]
MAYTERLKHGNGTHALNMQEWVNTEKGRISRHILTDPDIYDLEVTDREYRQIVAFLYHEARRMVLLDQAARGMSNMGVFF